MNSPDEMEDKVKKRRNTSDVLYESVMEEMDEIIGRSLSTGSPQDVLPKEAQYVAAIRAVTASPLCTRPGENGLRRRMGKKVF